MHQLWHLTCLEWRRTRGPVLGYFLLTIGLWGGVVFYFPVLRNGDMSADMILLTTSILTGILAYRSFAGDFGAGRLEFLFASGASPHALFLSRLFVALLASALFGGAFALV